MSENFSLPSPESLEALELAVTRNNTSVAGGARVGEIQNSPIRSMVEQQLINEQPVVFAGLVALGSTIDWEGIYAAERHAHHELEAAIELSKEAKANAGAQTASIEQSVIMAIGIAPDIEDKIRESANSQRQHIEQDLVLPAQELETERAQFYTQVEEVFMRAGQAWSIPNLVEIPQEIAPGRYPDEDPASESHISPSSAVLTETGLVLSERDQRMLDVILSAVSQGSEFRHADVDTGLAGLGLFDRRNKQQHAFGRLTGKLIGAGILEPRGERGGRSYVLLKGLVPHPEENQAGHEPTTSVQIVTPELEATQPVATPEAENEVPKFVWLRSVGSDRRGYTLSEGTFDEIKKHIGGKDRRLAPYLEDWLTCLFNNPEAKSAISVLSSSPAIRVTSGEEVQTAQLLYFSPKDVEGLEVGPYKRKIIIMALLTGDKIAIQKVIDRQDLDPRRRSR